MSRTAYVFIFLVIGLALVLHALDEKTDREGIASAAGIALYDGVMEACEQRNLLRDRITETAISLHPMSRRDDLRAVLLYEDCDALAKTSVDDFFRRLNPTD